MLAKILVGVIAAVAVTGVGVYYALPDYSQPTCPGHACPLEGAAVSEGTGCCAAACPTETVAEQPGCCAAKVATTVSETPSCCAAKGKSNADSLGACVGGMALTTTGPTAATKAAAHCCDE
jgi:hypothetical protein